MIANWHKTDKREEINKPEINKPKIKRQNTEIQLILITSPKVQIGFRFIEDNITNLRHTANPNFTPKE